MEKMRRFQRSASCDPTERATASKSTSSKTITTTGSPDNASLPNHLQTLKAKAVKVNTPVSEFFLF